MPSAAKILGELPAYTGGIKILSYEQGTQDIIDYMMAWHDKYMPDYDLICDNFKVTNPTATLNNIYAFLKKNVHYRVEGAEQQFVKSPSAIIATGMTQGSDCKNYSLFTGGVIDALNRQGAGIPFAYRFASYGKRKDPEHVFIVAWPGTAAEYWVDCVPPIRWVNDRIKKPTYYSDIIFSSKIGSMQFNNRQGSAIGASSVPNTNVGTGVALASTAVNAVSGNYVGAAVSFVTAIIDIFAGSGHSNWYKADQWLQRATTSAAGSAAAKTNWGWVAAYYNDFYNSAAFNSTGKNGFAGDLNGGIDGDIVPAYQGKHVPRYLMLPLVYAGTGDAGIYNMIADAIGQGLLPASSMPKNSPSATTGAATTATAEGSPAPAPPTDGAATPAAAIDSSLGLGSFFSGTPVFMGMTAGELALFGLGAYLVFGGKKK